MQCVRCWNCRTVTKNGARRADDQGDPGSISGVYGIHTFESIAGTLPSMVEGLDNPSIIVRYLNPDGEEITSMEFFATDAE